MRNKGTPKNILNICAGAFLCASIMSTIVSITTVKVLFNEEMTVLGYIGQIIRFIIIAVITDLTIKAYWNGSIILVIYVMYYSLAAYSMISSSYLFYCAQLVDNFFVMAISALSLIIHLVFGYIIVGLILFNKGVKQYMKEMRTVRKEKRERGKAQTLPEKQDLP